MPTRFVGIHLALSILLALVGLSFLADPCGGGGDLCLGGALGLVALGVAALGGVGILIWRFGRRASPLLVWDCALLASAGFYLLNAAPYGQGTLLVGALGAAPLAIAGAALAGRAVATHRIERILAIGVLAGAVPLFGEGGLAILALGLLALVLGWLLAREDISPSSLEAPLGRR